MIDAVDADRRRAARAFWLAAGLNLTLVSSAWAQQLPTGGGVPAPAPGAAAPTAVSASPDRTTATYGDWTLRCERPTTPAGAPRVCEIAQFIQIQGQQAPVAQIAIGRLQKADPLKATIVLPHNVSLLSQPGWSTEEKDVKPFDAVWQRCLPIGCIAEVILRDEALKRIRSRSEPGAIAFRDGAGREVKLSFSTRGIAQALDALAKE